MSQASDPHLLRSAVAMRSGQQAGIESEPYLWLRFLTLRRLFSFIITSVMVKKSQAVSFAMEEQHNFSKQILRRICKTVVVDENSQ
jgi:hypothetical protein